MKHIKVTNCQSCPFANDDNEAGKDCCNLDTSIIAPFGLQLPDDKVHERCPLKEGAVIIEIENETPTAPAP